MRKMIPNPFERLPNGSYVVMNKIDLKFGSGVPSIKVDVSHYEGGEKFSLKGAAKAGLITLGDKVRIEDNGFFIWWGVKVTPIAPVDVMVYHGYYPGPNLEEGSRLVPTSEAIEQ